MSGWNPWRALRERPHIELAIVPLPARAGGGIYWPRDGWAAVLLDNNLTRRERNAVLAHELVHDELGGGKESLVEKTVARRLVPLDALVSFVKTVTELGEGVSAEEVADHFDVPPAVAGRALELLADEERRKR